MRYSNSKIITLPTINRKLPPYWKSFSVYIPYMAASTRNNLPDDIPGN